jgi:type I restriction enzyme S subunit
MSENHLMSRDWPTLRFDQFADNVVERVDPAEAEADIYVGLEHLDPESLKIRRWGTPDDVKGEKLRFREGDIIFGRRRFYQRKLAVAEFDGICSAHAMVLRAREGVMLQAFLPFFLQSETFYQRAMQISVGSLSPTINWRALARQEFAVPPLDEQQRMAEILWAAETAIARYESVLRGVQELKRSTLTHLLTIGLDSKPLKETRIGNIPMHWKVMRVGDLLEICQYGLSIPLNDSGQYPILRMMNFDDGVVVPNDLKYVDLSDEEFANYQLQRGDILFNRTNSADLVGKVGIYRLGGDFVFASYLVRLRANRDLVQPDYLNYYLNSPDGQRRILSYATAGVSQTNINARNLQKVLIPVAPLPEQRRIVGILMEIDAAKVAITEQLGHLADLKRGLLSAVLDSTASE